LNIKTFIIKFFTSISVAPLSRGNIQIEYTGKSIKAFKPKQIKIYMETKQEQRFCKNCNEIMHATRRIPNHALQIILSIITAGIWLLVIYLPVVLCATTEKFKCIKCGNEVK
jgi:hypothetical protein